MDLWGSGMVVFVVLFGPVWSYAVARFAGAGWYRSRKDILGN
jgi:hypothetical protein